MPTCILGGPGIPDLTAHGHDPDRFVEVGSLSKVITGTVVAQLAKAGVLALDDPLERWLPEAPGGTGITLRHLVEHASGLPRLPPNLTPKFRDPYASFTDRSLREVVRTLDRVTARPPGSVSYSNLGYCVLGLALVTAADAPYQQLVDRHVLVPLGLEPGAMTAHPPEHRRLVRRGAFGRPRSTWTLSGPMLPAGGLWATPRTTARVLVGLAVDRALGEPAPSWVRTSTSVFHDGATRDSSVFAGARADGNWIVVHRLRGNGRRTVDLAVKTMKEATDEGR
ncbi:serine hydrolase domain-containing protein [Streptomyces sp. NPDC020412]|uniref:serine hydrolase domain-containing protein n=1 Tax=Streptomyces sp. NPDC020412 TaxID=3365073 RepID=UPI00379AFFC5